MIYLWFALLILAAVAGGVCIGVTFGRALTWQKARRK